MSSCQKSGQFQLPAWAAGKEGTEWKQVCSIHAFLLEYITEFERLAQKNLSIPISGTDKAHQPFDSFTWPLYYSTNILTARFVTHFLRVQTHLC